MGKLTGKALPHQYKFIHSKAKYPALVSGLGAGKTEALVYRTLKYLTEIPKAKIGIYEPTVDLIKRIIYPRFEDIFANSGIFRGTRLAATDNLPRWRKILIRNRSLPSNS